MLSPESIHELQQSFLGDFFTDEAVRRIYATDASVYREMPLAVAWPRESQDLIRLVQLASVNTCSLVPRSAGTSLAGQAVGSGIVVDVSRYMDQIEEFDAGEKTIWVQPGVVRDELNRFLAPHGLMFAPDTSTSNRATIGGMVGNNSCGSTSITYGSTRDHVIGMEVILGDGSKVEFTQSNEAEFNEKCGSDTLEGRIYSWVKKTLGSPSNAKLITNNFPDSRIRRRNTGYALDILLGQQPFNPKGSPFNLSSLICGSEGTLALVSRIKVSLEPKPSPEVALMVVHLESVEEAARATLVARKFDPTGLELLDRYLIQCASKNSEQRKNMFFLEGDPGALLIIEIRKASESSLTDILGELRNTLRNKGLGYAYPVLRGDQRQAVWALRKAGLGSLANLSGDGKAVACIEDTAVAIEDLPSYLSAFQRVIERYGKKCIYYGHIGDGELHLRPVLDLRLGPDRQIFQSITSDVAILVKKFRGSLSGEHGDGRVRGGFIEMMVGKDVYQLFRDLKLVFDPSGVFNPGKIIDVLPMADDLRVGEAGGTIQERDTVFRFIASRGLERMAESCNGSGDCRKSHDTAGVMCPSYMATRDERMSTRARANLLRDLINSSECGDPLARQDLHEILDSCLSCKGCKSECPSNVDMAMLKAEVLQRYQDKNGVSLRSFLIAEYPTILKVVTHIPGGRRFMNSGVVRKFTKPLLGIAQEREFPVLAEFTLHDWCKKHLAKLQPLKPNKRSSVVFFLDEFTNYHDVEAGVKAIKLMTSLGYQVNVPKLGPSGRTHISKGFVRRARKAAIKNVSRLRRLGLVGKKILGLEPSAILSFRDEYPDLVSKDLLNVSRAIAKKVMTWEEWFAGEVDAGRITSDDFGDDEKSLIVHTHCHQRALGDSGVLEKILSIPRGFTAVSSDAGCCGMAGSFGYEAEHYALSMKVGSLALFPKITSRGQGVEVAASGTSCRHQIKDGVGVFARHPAEWLYESREKKLSP
ncbi:FAD-binding protein, partial [Akkermansiaceae bacterium]|nr:FAD-binding protein [Akkermansiaceae bacterium]